MLETGRAWEPQRVLDGVPVALLFLSPDLIILDANDAYLTATMTSRETIAGRPLVEVFTDDPDQDAATGVANLRASLSRVLEHHVTDVMAIQKYSVAPSDSEQTFDTRYWACVNAPVFASDGTLGWIVHRVEDVTAYVLDQAGSPEQTDLATSLRSRTPELEAEIFARQQLVERDQSQRAVLDSLDTAVIGCDREGRAILTNQSARDLFAIPAHTAPTDQWAHRFRNFRFSDTHGNPLAPDDLPVAMLLRGEQVQDMLVVVKPDREAPRTFRVHGRAVNGGGRLAAVVALHDITVKRRAQRLKECEQLVARILVKPEPADHVLYNAIELIGDMLGWSLVEFWTVDEVAQVLRRRACWAAADELIPAGTADVLHKGDGIPGQAWDDREPVWVTDLAGHPAARRQSADWRTLHSALAVPLPSNSCVLGVLVCYSDNREIPGDMRTAVMTGISAHLGEFLERRRADQARAERDHTRDEYIALVGHELRTPLTSIQSYADMLLTEPDMPAGERQQLLEVVQRRTGELNALVAKLLDVAGTRAGHITARIRRMDLVAVTRAVVQHLGADEAVTLVLDAPPEVMIDGDPERLRTALEELLGNALTWAAVDSTVTVTVTADSHTAVAAITNTGAPIPADQHEKIFDAFYRTDDSRINGIPGFGLGLTLARAVVDQHGGSLTVSAPGEAATTFTVVLPTHQPDVEPH